MKTVLRILLIEDSEDDAILILHQIRKGNYDVEVQRVETAQSMKAALREKAWDIVLSDYSMPCFNGLEALKLLRESGIDIPFIVISGTIGEDVAVEMMKAGAQDYIMKSNLQRLLPAISRELRELKIRTERRLLEQKVEQERLTKLHFFKSLDQVNRIMHGKKDMETMMGDVLNAMLAIFDCDRAWLVCLCNAEESLWRTERECIKPEYIGLLAQSDEVPRDPELLEVFRTVLASSGPVQFGQSSEHPLSADLSRRSGTLSFLSKAIYPDEKNPYLLTLGQCSYPRAWTQEEERLLQEIGRRFEDGVTTLLSHHDLLESEAKYRRIVDTAKEGIWVIGEDLLTTFINARMAEMLGYSIREMNGRPMTDFLFAEDASDYHRKMEDRRQGVSEHYDCRFRRKDGETMWSMASAVPILDDRQDFKGLLMMVTDITERKRAEEALNRIKEELEQRVKERTKELERRNYELEQMNKVFVGRELRMVELKERIKKLEKRAEPEE